jgi:TP901 family phage tail tape measure protein
MTADEAVTVVDKLSAADLNYATSAEEIATALQYVAASANNADISLDKMIGLITVVSQQTRLSAEQIGNSFKTIIARMENIKVNNTAFRIG